MVALRNAVEIFAWAPKPYNRFMLYKSFQNLAHRPLVVDLTVEDGTKLKSKDVWLANETPAWDRLVWPEFLADLFFVIKSWLKGRTTGLKFVARSRFKFSNLHI